MKVIITLNVEAEGLSDMEVIQRILAWLPEHPEIDELDSVEIDIVGIDRSVEPEIQR